MRMKELRLRRRVSGRHAPRAREVEAEQQGGLSLRFEPRGPDTARAEVLTRRVLENAELRAFMGRARYQALSFALVEPESEDKSAEVPDPERFVVTLYDYTHNRTVFAGGRLDGRGKLDLSESGIQPRPSAGEFATAVELLSRDEALGPELREGRLRVYAPMPPLIETQTPEGRSERTVAVGLRSTEPEARNEIVGVNLVRRTVHRYEGGAPPESLAVRAMCGVPSANQPTASGTAGQVWVTVSQGNTVLWRFLAVRPAASSGTNGSGVELRYVDYRGKRLLYRAHVPVLNVKYDGNACGPYLDWQNQEGMLQASGTDVGSGFRLCPAPAKTVLDNGQDAGTFLGVAIYVQGAEVVLVSEMEAGWYRYISQWRLHANGTLRPRFGFSAVESSCVCKRHHHHAYWRFDFDLRTPGDNRVREYNDPPLSGSSRWHVKRYEVKRSRDPARNRKWRVENTRTGEAYDIIPGPSDGVATASPDWPFPGGDVWILRYRSTEIDNGTIATGPPYDGGLDGWVNGESIENRDVVFWYAAHFTHDLTQEEPGHFGHIVGPDLKPVEW
jgi:hypothetical protein